MKGVGDIDQMKITYAEAKKSFFVAIKSSPCQSNPPPVSDSSIDPFDGTHTDAVCTILFDTITIS